MLIFKSITSYHSGAYTCSASNSAAKVNYTAELMVKGDNFNILLILLNNINISKCICFSSSSLDCRTCGYVSAFGTYYRCTLFSRWFSWSNSYVVTTKRWILVLYFICFFTTSNLINSFLRWRCCRIWSSTYTRWPSKYSRKWFFANNK